MHVTPHDKPKSPSSPINWLWFQARRRGLGSGMISFFFHLGLCLLLMLLTQSPGSSLKPRDSVVIDAEWHEPQTLEFFEPQPLESPSGRPAPRQQEPLDDGPEVPEIKPPRLALEEQHTDAPAPEQSPEGDIQTLESQHGDSPVPQSQRRTTTKFFGIESEGEKFVYLVDCSWSMRGARWHNACDQLLATLGSLREDQFFYVIFFDIDARRMFGPGHLEPDFARATPENIDRLQEWIEQLKLGYETDPFEAVKIAVQLEPDAIYLVSDGEFRDSTRLYLRQSRRSGPDGGKPPATLDSLRVHTVALHGREGQKELQAIAKESGGTFRFVPDPRRGWAKKLAERAPSDNPERLRMLRRLGASYEIDGEGRVWRVLYQGGDDGLSDIAGLPHLRELWLPESRITDAGLAAVADLQNLRHLVLSHTGITDAGLVHLQRLNRLRRLFLEGTKVTDKGMSSVARLSKLQALSTPGNLTDEGVRSIAELDQLETLYLMEPRLTDDGLEHVAGLQHLERVFLNGSKIGDAGVALLKTLTELETLHLTGTQVKGTGLHHLSSLSQLRELSLADTPLSDSGLAHVRSLSQLEILDLRQTEVTDSSLDLLRSLEGLRELNIAQTHISSAGVRKLRAAGIQVVR